MSAETPNMVDAALALGTEHPEVGGILSLIADQMAADSAHWQGIQDAWHAEALAKLAAMEHGVKFALSQSEWGGTTRSYEHTLCMIERAMDDALFDGPIRRWYIERFTEDQFFDGVHPAFERRGPM